MRKWTRRLGLTLIINDRPDIACLAGADGVHVGQDDLPLRQVRRIVGPDAVVGVSTHNIEQAHAAVADGADYIGVGPVFPSKTKSFGEYPGLAYVRQVAQEISIPAFCIGGIDTGNLETLRAAGATRIAVSAVLATATEPMGIARTLRGILEK